VPEAGKACGGYAMADDAPRRRVANDESVTGMMVIEQPTLAVAASASVTWTVNEKVPATVACGSHSG